MNRLLFVFFLASISHSVVAGPYWQQHLNVKIEVRLDDRHHFLNGYEEIVYTNNSPDTLRYIYMHLWPNAYKNDHTPFARQMDQNGNSAFYYSKSKDRGYIDSLQFNIDGQNVDYNSTDNAPDIARIDLNNPLLPGREIKITTPFRVKIPKVFSRMGHTKQAYFISQWFPKPAVYDRVGWHPISYMDQGEFYSEYGTYDVAITLPKNYVLMATGNCKDESENQWLDQLSKLPLPADTLYGKNWPASAEELKTVHFHEDNVHDFAWFADKRWIVRKDTVHSPGTDKVITTWAAFLPAYKQSWLKANDYLKETVKHYGKWVGPYPYETIKAVLGDMKAGGGMEYPTITVIDKSASINFKTVVIHEAGHNWFYGMLGTNERDHAWMDEGINTFYEQKTLNALKNIPSSLDYKVSTLNENTLYYEQAATHNDQGIEQTSGNFTKLNYGVDVYYKTALMLNWLESYMGKAEFQEAMRAYFILWQYKHPYPKDFRLVMQQHTTKSLDWFFDDIMSTDKKIDFKITHVKKENGSTSIIVHNNTGVFSPVRVDAYLKDSLVASVWSEPIAHNAIVSVPVTNWTTLHISNVVPDGKTANNEYARSALFHRFGIKLTPVAGLNMSEKDKVSLSPAIGFNQYDGFMFGILFHDLTIPENRFRYAIAPMFATGSKTLVGAASIGYTWYPDNLFKEVLLQADVKSFNYNKTNLNTSAPVFARYIKAAPSLHFTFNEHNLQSPVTRELTLKAYYISEDNFNFGDSLSKPATIQQTKVYGLLRYQHRNDRAYNPFGYSIEGQMGADFAKINLEGNVRIDYNVKNKSLYVRAYAGKFFAITADPAIASRYYLNSSFTGIDDYLYDDTYISRTATNSIEAQQISIREGGFKIPTYNSVGRSDNWLAAINLKTDLPLGILPIRIFLDAALLPNTTPDKANPGDTRVLYDGGLEVHLLKDIIDVYVPFIMSSDLQNYLSGYGNKNKFARGISFTLQLQNINWLKAPGKALKMISN